MVEITNVLSLFYTTSPMTSCFSQ